MARTLLIGLCIFAILNLHYADSKPALRNRRYIEDDDGEYEDYNRDEEDSNELRETRRVTTYPPFPGEESWWYQDTSEDPTPQVTPSTEKSYRREPEVEKEEETFRKEPEIEKVPEEEEKKFHEKVVPWFKRQWGHTKNFFKTHYDTAKNSIG